MSTGEAIPRQGLSITATDSAPWLACALVAVLALTWPICFGWGTVVVHGSLPNPDSFTRINRIFASIEAGHVLSYVPRDNSGVPVPLHWSHLLDIAILALALPLIPHFGLADALRLGGAMIGPVTVAAYSLSAMYAVRVATGHWRLAAVAGVSSALATGALSYGALGRADHHVLLATLATLTLTFAWRAGTDGARPARIAGFIAAMGMWISPEMLPFSLIGWAIAITGDGMREGRVGERATGYALVNLTVLAIALALDPPAHGLWAPEIDRLSRPFVELAAMMAAASLIAGRFMPASDRTWTAVILGATVAAAAVLPWVWMYPQLLHGAEGVFSAEGWRRIWADNGEIKSPLGNAASFCFFYAVPLAILVLATAWLLLRRRGPLDVLAAVIVLFALYLGYRYIRLTIYPQQAAAIALAVMLAWAMRPLAAGRAVVTSGVIVIALAVLPWAGSIAFNEGKPAVVRCDAQSVAPALAPFAGRIVLSPYMDAPSLIYFTDVLTVAGPYHRAERRILNSLDAYEARDFAAAAPPAFRRTGAVAVLVCTRKQQAPHTLGAALAAGNPPAWLQEERVPSSSGYRLYALRAR